MVVLRAFFDDSGSDESSQFIVAAGYIATVAHWDRLSSVWGRVMKGWGLEWFHMTCAEKMSTRDGTLVNGYGWDWRVRDERVSLVGELVDQTVMGAVGCWMNRALWKKYVKPQMQRCAQYDQEMGFPYAEVYTGCLALTRQIASQFKVPLDSVEIVFAEQKKHGPKAREATRRILSNFGLRDPHFGNMQELAPLQCADIAAWLTNKSAREGAAFINRPRYNKFLQRSAAWEIKEEMLQAYGDLMNQAATRPFPMKESDFVIPKILLP